MHDVREAHLYEGAGCMHRYGLKGSLCASLAHPLQVSIDAAGFEVVCHAHFSNAAAICDDHMCSDDKMPSSPALHEACWCAETAVCEGGVSVGASTSLVCPACIQAADGGRCCGLFWLFACRYA